MSTIKDLIDEEKKIELIIKEAEDRSKRMIDDAKRKAEDLIRNAQNNESVVRDVISVREKDMSTKKELVFREFEEEANRVENLCNKNFERAIDFVMDKVLGARS